MLSLLLITFITINKAAIRISDDEIYELTPFGYWLSDCYHSISGGGHINNIDDKTFSIDGVHKTRCHTPHNSTYINERITEYYNKIEQPMATGNGWQAYVKQDAGSTAPVTTFNGYWTVPAYPSKKSLSEVLYTFTALQNIDWVPPEREPAKAFDIIQPVLQYGAESGKGGGDYWGVSSWYVTLSNDVIQSPLIQVSVGDNIYGQMIKTGTDSWFINGKDMNTGHNTSFTVSRSILSTQPWVYVTLEVYNINDCNNEYPPTGTTIPYTQLVLDENGKNANLDFQVGTNGQSPPVCNSKITINSDTAVTITF